MIEFLEEPHLYLKDGILVKSVTQILQLIFPDKYKNVNSIVLNKKAQFGTIGHSIIEHLDVSNLEHAENNILSIENKDLQICIREYLRLVKTFKIEPLEHEKIVSYQYLFCGTLDLIAKVNGVESLCDIKFTAELDKEYLSWQLGMYAMALGKSFKKYYCVWLPKKELGQLVEIVPKTQKEILNKLKDLGLNVI
jgi:hypothetical protein